MLQFVLLRKVAAGGMLADNDGICHYSYLRHFVEEFWPQTHALFGFSPRFNFGGPFLLYNVPPGLTWVAASLVALGFSPAVALKSLAVTSYLALGPLASRFGRYLDPSSTALPRFLALSMMLFSSELFGFEFYFRNGMLNACCAIPLVLGGMLLFCRALHEPERSLRWLALTSVVYACTLLVHVLSAYMLTLALLSFAVGFRLRAAGRGLLSMVAVAAVGAGLAAFWLLPSAPFAAAKDGAYTWVRSPLATLSTLADGSLLTSYFGGFFPNFLRVSNVGIVPVAMALLGSVEGIRRANGVVRSLVIFAVLCLVVVLGPEARVGALLPGFDRLLWYRFVTPLILAVLVLGAYGASQLVRLEAARRLAWVGLGVSGFFALWGLFVPAKNVETERSFPSFEESYRQIVDGLRAEARPEERVFGEFLGFGVMQPPSVNYLRHMIPIDTGLGEISSWIYENNPTSQHLLRLGPFWYDPLPLLDVAEEYGVRYVVAGSPHLVRALDADSRFEPVRITTDLAAYRTRHPRAFATVGPLIDARVVRQQYLRGGGYTYTLELPPHQAEVMRVRVNYDAHAWTVRVDDRLVTPRSSSEGFLEFDVPADAARVELYWDIAASRARANWVSAAAVILVLGALVFSWRSRALSALAERIGPTSERIGRAAAVAGAVACSWRATHLDLSEIGFGIRGGLLEGVKPNDLALGQWRDLQTTGCLSLVGDSWARANGVAAGRIRRDSGLPMFRFTALAGELLHIEGAFERGTLRLRGNQGRECRLAFEEGRPVAVPPECMDLAEAHSDKPGVSLDAFVDDVPMQAAFTRIALDHGPRVVQAESLSNDLYDGGLDAFYSTSQPPYVPLNGSLMVGVAAYDKPIELHGEVSLAAGAQDVWVLLRTIHPRFARTRGIVDVLVDGVSVGGTNGATEVGVESFWSSAPTFGWARAGRLSNDVDVEALHRLRIRIRKAEHAVTAGAEIDAVAFLRAMP